MEAFDIAIVGGGFSGAMVLGNFVRAAQAPARILLADESGKTPRGVAYSTPYDAHLLNVRAGRMGAFAEDIGGFHRWLQERGSGLTEENFAPRKLYGDYLEAIWHETLETARKKNIAVILSPAAVTRIAPGFTLELDNGETASARHLVLATGNRMRKTPRVDSPRYVSDFWDFDFSGLSEKSGTAVLIGTGLTAVDAVLTLRAEGWSGPIIALSRHGLLPAVHESYVPHDGGHFARLAGKPLRQIMRAVRKEAKHSGAHWQAVIDSLRPHTQSLWQGLSPRDRERFFQRLFTFWSVHRHRMASEIGEAIARELAQGSLGVRHGGIKAMQETEEVIEITLKNGDTLRAAHVFDCTGPDYSLKRDAGMLAPLIEAGMIEPLGHYGMKVGEKMQVWQDKDRSIHALGNLAVGALLECTAVPELRAQAAQVATSLAEIGEIS